MQKPNFTEAPHLRELKTENSIKIADKFSRIFDPNSKQKLPYQRRNHEVKTIQKWGQRKLLLGEIEFLTNHINDLHDQTPKEVLYIGAAPGIHLPYLIKLFPQLHFILYDPRDFCFKSSDFQNVTIYQCEFNNDIAQKYKGKNLLFISDIRGDCNTYTTRDQESMIQEDMYDQKTWYEIIQPTRAFLKFRLPWSKGKTKYLSGQLYNQIWTGSHSTETRIIPDGFERVYDHTIYEQQMYYFNIITRRKWYNHDYPCLGHCYDCMAELHILELYVSQFPNSDVVKMNQEITDLLTENNKSYLRTPFVKT